MGHVSALDPLTAGTEDCLVERGSSARQEKKIHRLIKSNFLTCMFFSHFRPRDSTTQNYFHAHINAYLTKRQRQIPWRTSRGLNWENKAYKLKRSIEGSRRWVGLLQDQPLKCWPRLASEKGDPDPAFPLFFSRESRIPNFSHVLFRILFSFSTRIQAKFWPIPLLG